MLRDEAIRYIEEDRAIHEQWARYLENDPTAMSLMVMQGNSVGDITHHREWMRRLDIVLAALRMEMMR